MSINSALLAGVSGLTANSAALAAISQNIANVNTIGYKRTASEFSTVVNSQSQGSGYSAGGVQAQARHYVSQSGQLQRTSSSTDLGISGQGFFVVTDKSENLQPTDTRLFTRAGAFTVDKLGYLQNTAGLYLQGWPIDSNGNINTDPSDLNRLRSINIGSVGGTAEPTTRAQLNANLNDAQPISAAAADAAATPPGPNAYDPATNNMASHVVTDENPVGVRPDFQITVPISDSKGGQRSIAISFLKTNTANEWYAEVHAVPADSVETGAGLVDGQLKTGLVRFTQDGRLDIAFMATANAANGAAPGPYLFDDFNAAALTLGGSEPGAPLGPDEAKWAEDFGIEGQTITFELNTSAGGLSQLNTESTTLSTVTNGTAFGNLSSIDIDEEGFVTASFDNGVIRQIAQVAIGTFTSPDNLLEVSGNAYKVSQGSGTYNLKTPGNGGAGLIASSQLESSTVDLSAEFTGLITTQRAYSASSKIITTADEMLAELISIKR